MLIGPSISATKPPLTIRRWIRLTRERLAPRGRWNYDTGAVGEFQSNGLVIDGVLYTATTRRKVLALNAATGKHIWTFDPAELRPGNQGRRQRGVIYWASGNDKRIFTGAGAYLYALDADERKAYPKLWEGRLDPSRRGIETHGGTAADPRSSTLRESIYKDMYIVGGSTNGPGAIRAYDVRTGRVRWIFHLIPRPGRIRLPFLAT